MFIDPPVFKKLTLFFPERSRNESVDLIADLGYDIMAMVDVIQGGFNKELVGVTKYEKENRLKPMLFKLIELEG